MIALKKGAKLREFVLEDQIGIGSSAIVWKAVDTQLNRDVAIKRPLRQGQQLSQPEMTQFKEEAQRGAKLIHTNIVQVYQIIPEDDDLFLVLEYVDGVSLWDELRSNAINGQSMSLEQSVWILRDILSGLAFAHGQGICHRDLKPANILLTRTRIPKIADLGIARFLGTPDKPEKTPSVQGGTGTPDFMSPEQARGEDADFSSDLFMVGIIGYLLLSGRHPYAHSSGLFQIQELLRNDDYMPPQLKPPTHLSSSESRLFREYAAIVMRLLERERTSRYLSAKEANQALAAVSPFLDCPSCGTRLPESSNFCSECGERLALNRQVLSTQRVQDDGQPENAKDLSDEGYRLSRAQEWDQAIRAYKRALELDGTFQRTYWNLAYALNHVGDYEEAISIATKGLTLPEAESRHRANLLNVRAFAFGRLKRYEEAIADLDQALKIDPDGIEHLYYRARVNAYRGEILDAILDTDDVLARNPQHPGALRLRFELAEYDHVTGS